MPCTVVRGSRLYLLFSYSRLFALVDVFVRKSEYLRGVLAQPAGFGIDAGLYPDEVDVFEVGGLSVLIDRVRDFEIDLHGACCGIVVLRKTVVAEIVGVAPVVFAIDPVGAVARLVVGAALQAGTVKRIAVRADPRRVVAGLVVVLFQVVDLALDALVVLPLYVGSRVGRPVNCRRFSRHSLLIGLEK